MRVSLDRVAAVHVNALGQSFFVSQPDLTLSLTLFLIRASPSQAHVVSAFEQSLSNMTNRLQHLTSTAEAKVRAPSPELPSYAIRFLCSK